MDVCEKMDFLMIVFLVIGISSLTEASLLNKQQCSINEFECTDGTCIDIQYKCDGSADCADGGDEKYCHQQLENKLLQRSKRATGTKTKSGECGRIPEPMIHALFGVAWHASIYTKESEPYRQICIGSIISKTVIISAAHCFWDEVDKKLNSPSLYAVATGKRRTIWLDTPEEEKEAQRFNVTDIKVPPQFRGSDGYFESDIALLILDKEIIFTWFTTPVCIDLISPETDKTSKGLISGWGVRPQNNVRSEELQYNNFPYINNTECLRHSPKGFEKYITPDKVCAGEDNGTNICSGDSGAGMAYIDFFRYNYRYYLKSILTTAPPLGNTCGTTPFIALTKISSHRKFIADNVVLDYESGDDPECGIAGNPGKQYEMPWYAAIYKLMDKKFVRICSGSLISHTVVISAAHCFWDSAKQRLDNADKYNVALGKYFALDERKSDSVQQSPISDIKIGPRFNGDVTNYADDIALLFLTEQIQYTSNVRPVCVNFDQDLDRLQLNTAKFAKMAGFGVAPVDNEISDVVKVVDLPLINITDCLKRSPENFKQYLASDKICAGFENTTKICLGDSGTGLVFPDNYRNVYKYYLRGILSLAPPWPTGGICGETPVVGFTWLLQHESFVASYVADSPRVAVTEIKKVVKTECGILPLYLEPLSIGGREANHSEMPWHAGIYRKKFDLKEKRAFYEQICGGSLISNNVIISAAHCFANDEAIRWKVKQFAVAVGKLYRDWDDPRDKQDTVQKSGISDVIIPDNFYGSVTRFQADIALVKLASQFQYKENVVPVCLDFDYEFDKRQLKGGGFGKVAGWGYINEDGVSSPILKVVEEPIYDNSACFHSIPTSSKELITTDKICGGYVDGTQALCKGDSGGGLVVPAVEAGIVRYYLRGIVSTATTSIKKCNRFSLTYFTRVRVHQYLITESLTNTTDSIETTSATPQTTKRRPMTTELTLTTKTLQTTERTQALSHDSDDKIHFPNDK